MKERLKNLVYHFREVIESIPRSEFNGQSSMGATQFPGGCCDDSSHLLAEYVFQELNLILDLVHGEFGGLNNEIRSHAWLSCDDVIIDITYDQFDWRGYHFPSVYLGFAGDFHSTFTIKTKPDARYTQLSDQGGLGGAYAVVSARL